MITSKQIIQLSEDYDKLISIRGQKIPLYSNPTSSDLLELNKSIKNSDKFIRFIADAKARKVYIWDGTLAIHSDVVTSLGLGNIAYVREQPNFLLGYCSIVSGKLILMNQHDSVEKLSSIIDALFGYYAWNFSKPEVEIKFGKDIRKSKVWTIAFFMYNWSFLSLYISGTSQYINKEKERFEAWRKDHDNV